MDGNFAAVHKRSASKHESKRKYGSFIIEEDFSILRAEDNFSLEVG